MAFKACTMNGFGIRQIGPVIDEIHIIPDVRHKDRDKVAGQLVQRLAALLNSPVLCYYPGRYIMDPDDDNGFLDTWKIVHNPGARRETFRDLCNQRGEYMKYSVVGCNETPILSAVFRVDRLVGMLNYAEHTKLWTTDF